MSAVEVQPFVTPEEYLAREELAETRSEYYNGQIYAMAGSGADHILITSSLVVALYAQLRGRPCRVYPTEMRVRVSETGAYTYPDIAVVCGPAHFEGKTSNTLLNPTVLVEVLSPSTESHDRGDKFAHYRRLESLREYVLVSQDRIRVEHYLRQGEQWLLTEFDGPEAVLALPSIGCEVPLSLVYEQVEFAPDELSQAE